VNAHCFNLVNCLNICVDSPSIGGYNEGETNWLNELINSS